MKDNNDRSMFLKELIDTTKKNYCNKPIDVELDYRLSIVQYITDMDPFLYYLKYID